VHRKIDVLSTRSKDLLRIGYGQRRTCEAVAEAIRLGGENFSARLISRTWRGWREEEVQEKVLRGLNADTLSSLGWRAEEVMDLASNLDLAPGAYIRRRQRLYAAIRRFLRNPSCDGMRLVEFECLSLVLEARLLREAGVRAVPPAGKSL
jgi:hypothetical protein